jgi:arginase
MPDRKVALIGVPMDLGADRRGVDMGPSAIRVTRLGAELARLGFDVLDCGNLVTPVPEACPPPQGSAKYAAEIEAVCVRLRSEVGRTMEEGRLPVVLGGDHSLAMGSVAGAASHHAARGESIGLLWVDAHGDMNTPQSTLSGNVHGMPLSRLVGMWRRGEEEDALTGCVATERACLLGVRDLDEREKKLIAQSGVLVLTMKDVDRSGVAATVKRALATTTLAAAGIWVSFDMDVVDPALAPGVGTPKKGGLNYREAHLLMELLADSGRVIGLDMVEVNPILDVRNQTAELASELVLSALGKQIF